MFAKLSLGFSFLLLFSSQISAQVTTATIVGTVRDETGAVLPGVTITVKNLETGIVRTLISDDGGRYRAPALQPGGYELRAELAGFQVGVRRGITLAVGQEAVVDIVLKVGELTEEVVVIGEAPLVDTTSSTITGLVDDRQIRDLPLNGRSFTQLALLQAGVSAFLNNTPGFFNGRGVKITVYGARFFHNSFLLDGTDVNDMYNNTPGSVAGVMLGVETVREFKVVTHNFSAEYGRAAGAVINAVTQSGTNELHGSAFEFHRNSALDAKNFFDPPDKPIPPFKRNQFGFTLGGPLRRDESFFFGSYEGLRESLGVTKVALVPDQNARRGLLPEAGTGRLVEVGVNPAVRPYLEALPLPNGRNLGGGIGEFLFSFNQPTREDFFTIRIDQKISDSDSFFARYTFDDADAVRLPTDLPIFQEPEVSRNQYVTVEEKHIFSPRVLSTFRFGFNRSFSEVFDEPMPKVTPPPPFRPELELMGDITIGGLSRIGTDFRVPIRNAMSLYEFSDDLAITSGAHSIKAGFLIKRIPWNISQWAQQRGSFNFADLEQFLRGRTVSGTAAVPGSDVTRSINQSLLGFYIQDDFKASDNLTLNLGLRYEFITVPTEKFGRMAGLRSLDDRAMTLGPPFENPSLRNFAPRIGFAWDPFRDRKTSIRGGFGLFHDQVITSHLIPTISLIPPFFVRQTRFGAPFPNQFEGQVIDLRSITPSTWTLWPFDLKNPVMLHYNLMIDRELLPDTVFRIGYAGSRGIHMSRHVAGNPATPQILQDGRLFFPPGSQRINPNFSVISLRSYDANTFYNALLLSVNRRFSRGLQFQVSYTFGKSIDDLTQINASDARNADLGGQNPFDRKADRGLSNHDIRHNLTLNYTYDLPFGPGRAIGANLAGLAGGLVGGWQVNGIVTVTSGNPFNVTVAGNHSRSQVGNDRPNLRPGASNNPVLGGPDRYFDPSAFELQPAGFFGNLARNTVIGPGLATFDFSLVKNNNISERFNLQFRAEFFNLFNRPNFATPLRVALSARGVIPTAGKITETVTTSRQIQFGLKLIF